MAKEDKEALDFTMRMTKLASNPNIVSHESKATLSGAFKNMTLKEDDIKLNKGNEQLQPKILVFKSEDCTLEELIPGDYTGLSGFSTHNTGESLYSTYHMKEFIENIGVKSTGIPTIFYKSEEYNLFFWVNGSNLLGISGTPKNFTVHLYQWMLDNVYKLDKAFYSNNGTVTPVRIKRVPTMTHDKVAIRLFTEDSIKETDSGLLSFNSNVKFGDKGEVQESDKVRVQTGQIVSIGPGLANTTDGKLISMQYQLGDVVMVGRFAGTDVELDGLEYRICRDFDLICKIV